MTNETKNIYAAFVKAQQGFAPAIKNSVNAHFRNKYADLGACIEAVIDSLNENGIGLVQKNYPSEAGILVETLLVHVSGESMSSGQLFVPASKNDPQGYGSALSYGRRYSLMAACGIAPEDDDGNAASKPTKAPTAAPKHRPTDGVTVDPARESALLDTVEAIKEAFERDSIIDAYGYATEVTDSEEKVFIWGKLPANIRSAIKKHGETLKKDEK